MTKSVSEFTVIYRGQSLQISQRANTTIGDLGHQLQSITGIAPHTMKLLLAHGRLLMPFTDSHASLTLTECGINDGVSVRMLGVLPQEMSAVSRTLEKSAGDRIVGFDEEEKRAMRRLPGSGSTIIELPSGPYIFHEFRTLRLDGVEQLNPSPERALHLMHQLASDRGIVAIMNKYRWSVGMLTEMPPIGHVGISPKCLLGVNKNHGEEISLRLRTDDLKGFRKYDVIKKTLLHELAHMVYSEHDERFYRLDKQLNKEATLLDWTKSKGHSLNGGSYEPFDKSVNIDTAPAGGNHLGGVVNVANPREAAASAAIKRLEETQTVLQDINSTIQSPKEIESDQHMRPIVHSDNKMLDPEISSIDIDKSSLELDSETKNNVKKNSYEPDPDDQGEPDPDDAPQSAKPLGSESWGLDPDMSSEEFSVIMDATSQITACLQQAMTKLKYQATPSEIQLVLQTLSTILRNIVEHPHDVKYRRLRKTNSIFQHRVAKFEGAIEVLKTIGFVDDDSEYQHEYLILKRDDPGLLWLARSFLETCAP